MGRCRSSRLSARRSSTPEGGSLRPAERLMASDTSATPRPSRPRRRLRTAVALSCCCALGSAYVAAATAKPDHARPAPSTLGSGAAPSSRAADGQLTARVLVDYGRGPAASHDQGQSHDHGQWGGGGDGGGNGNGNGQDQGQGQGRWQDQGQGQ